MKKAIAGLVLFIVASVGIGNVAAADESEKLGGNRWSETRPVSQVV